MLEPWLEASAAHPMTAGAALVALIAVIVVLRLVAAGLKRRRIAHEDARLAALREAEVKPRQSKLTEGRISRRPSEPVQSRTPRPPQPYERPRSNSVKAGGLASEPFAQRLSSEPISPQAEHARPQLRAAEKRTTARFFVSSTFLDMQAERDVLVKQVFPLLREHFRKRGVEVFEVDLRWGITREQAERGETLSLLLSEIDRCRPYFMLLLGDRYGWVPPPAVIAQLQAAHPVLGNTVGASVTEIEALHGLVYADGAVRALVFDRAPGAVVAEVQRESNQAKHRLAKLRSAVRSCGANVIDYRSLSEFRERALAALTDLLDRDFPQTDSNDDPLAASDALHQAFAQDRYDLHVGAGAAMSALDQWAGDAAPGPMLIVGESGSGKSALVANWTARYVVAHPDSFVFEHYLGAAADAGDPHDVMRRLWARLDRVAPEQRGVLPQDLATMSKAVWERVGAIASARRGKVVIALDGLDKLPSEDSAVSWLNPPANVLLVCSSLRGPSANVGRARRWRLLEMEPLAPRERRDLVAGLLSAWGRSLPIPVVDRVVAHRESGNPLFLRTLLHELRVSATDAVLQTRVSHYLGASDLPGFFSRVLDRICEDNGDVVTRRALSLISVSRRGLEEAEILAIGGLSPLEWSSLRASLGDLVREHVGRMAFGHDYFKNAVTNKYLQLERDARLTLAQAFRARPPSPRRAEEVAYQLKRAEAWDELERFLCDLDEMPALHEVGASWLWGHWASLRGRGACKPEALLTSAFDRRLTGRGEWTSQDLLVAFQILSVLEIGGISSQATRTLAEQAVAQSMKLHGDWSGETVFALERLAAILIGSGDDDTALTVQDDVTTRWFKQVVATGGKQGLDEYLRAQSRLGDILVRQGSYDAAYKMHEMCYDTARQRLGAAHATTDNLALSLASTALLSGERDKALELARQVWSNRLKSLGPDAVSTIDARFAMGKALLETGRLQEAANALQEAHEHRLHEEGSSHPGTVEARQLLQTLRQRGVRPGSADAPAHEGAHRSPRSERSIELLSTLSAQAASEGRHREACDLFEELIEKMQRTYGANHAHVLICKINYGHSLMQMGEKRRALSLIEEAQPKLERALGASHPHVGGTRALLTTLMWDVKDFELAKAVLSDQVQWLQRELGAEHPDTLDSMTSLATTLLALKQTGQACGWYDKVFEIRRRVLGDHHPTTKESKDRAERAKTAFTNERVDEALKVPDRRVPSPPAPEPQRRSAEDLRLMVEYLRDNLGAENAQTISQMSSLGLALRREGDLDGAAKIEEEVLDLRRRILGQEHNLTLRAMYNLGLTLRARKEIARAQEVQETMLEIRLRQGGPEDDDTLHAKMTLALTLHEAGDAERTERLLREVLEVRRRVLGEDHEDTKAVKTLIPALRTLKSR